MSSMTTMTKWQIMIIMTTVAITGNWYQAFSDSRWSQQALCNKLPGENPLARASYWEDGSLKMLMMVMLMMVTMMMIVATIISSQDRPGDEDNSSRIYESSLLEKELHKKDGDDSSSI